MGEARLMIETEIIKNNEQGSAFGSYNWCIAAEQIIERLVSENKALDLCKEFLCAKNSPHHTSASGLSYLISEGIARQKELKKNQRRERLDRIAGRILGGYGYPIAPEHDRDCVENAIILAEKLIKKIDEHLG